MALRLAVVVSQAPGLGGTPPAGHRWTAAANASAAASSATSRSPKRLVREATTRAHSSWWAWVTASRASTTLTGTAAPRSSGCSASTLGGELERHVEVGGLDNPEAGEILLRLQEGPVGEHRLPTSVVDDGGRAGRREATGEDPVTLRPEPVVERVDVRHLVRSGEAGRVVDHGNQVLHLGSSPAVRGAPRGRPLTPATNTSAPIRHRLPDFLPRTFWYAGYKRSDTATVPGRLRSTSLCAPSADELWDQIDREAPDSQSAHAAWRVVLRASATAWSQRQ